jgi:hypothetical protein
MKTYIIQLEHYDDLISARDKMNWAKGGRILLVWPEHKDMLNRRLDMVLLQRKAIALGAQLALATRDREARYQALRLGIPVFKNLRQAQNDNWRVPRRFRKSSPAPTSDRPPGIPARPEAEPARLSPLARLGIFTLGVLAVLSIAATLLPSAQISLTPQTRVQEVVIDTWTGPQVTQVNLAGAVPAHWVKVTVEGRDSLPASETLRLPDQPAIGEVVFTNLTDQLVGVPSGTVVRSQGKLPQRFTVTRSGQIPAGPGTTLTLPVRALAPGAQGNLIAGSLTAMESLLGTRVSVTNPAPTRGGSDRQEPAPSAADRQKLTEQLQRTLQGSALNELRAGLSQGDLLIPSSLKLTDVIETHFQPGEGQPSDRLSLSQQLEYQALVVSAQDLRTLVESVFDANLPPGFIPFDETLQIEMLTPPAPAENETVRWQLHANRQMLAQLSESQAVQLSLGRSIAQAQGRMRASLPLEEPPHITLTPTWWPRLPILPFRIAIHRQPVP